MTIFNLPDLGELELPSLEYLSVEHCTKDGDIREPTDFQILLKFLNRSLCPLETIILDLVMDAGFSRHSADFLAQCFYRLQKLESLTLRLVWEYDAIDVLAQSLAITSAVLLAGYSLHGSFSTISSTVRPTGRLPSASRTLQPPDHPSRQGAVIGESG